MEFLLARECSEAGVTGGSAQTAPEIEPAFICLASSCWQNRFVRLL
jgi:hypothetical protein